MHWHSKNWSKKCKIRRIFLIYSSTVLFKKCKLYLKIISKIFWDHKIQIEYPAYLYHFPIHHCFVNIFLKFIPIPISVIFKNKSFSLIFDQNKAPIEFLLKRQWSLWEVEIFNMIYYSTSTWFVTTKILFYEE